MKRNEKIKATWLSLMGIMSRSLVTETIELYDDNYNTIAKINCIPNDDDGIDEINFSKWLCNHVDVITNDCDLVILFKCIHNVTARISGSKKCETNEINLSKWLFNRTDTITNERELADVFARTRHMVCKVDDNTAWRHSVNKFLSGARYAELVRRSTKDDEYCGLIITDKRRLSRF